MVLSTRQLQGNENDALQRNLGQVSDLLSKDSREQKLTLLEQVLCQAFQEYCLSISPWLHINIIWGTLKKILISQFGPRSVESESVVWGLDINGFFCCCSFFLSALGLDSSLQDDWKLLALDAMKYPQCLYLQTPSLLYGVPVFQPSKPTGHILRTPHASCSPIFQARITPGLFLWEIYLSFKIHLSLKSLSDFSYENIISPSLKMSQLLLLCNFFHDIFLCFVSFQLITLISPCYT